MLTLIYTSGTTGPPKGVQLTHANVLAECRGVDAGAPSPIRGGTVVSFLPHAHIADRGLTHYGQMCVGPHGHLLPDPRRCSRTSPTARPTFFGGVPRVWEKLKAALEAGIAAEPDDGSARARSRRSSSGCARSAPSRPASRCPRSCDAACARAEELVFSPIRAKLGLDRCERYMVGAAPTPLEVLEFFAAIGIPICEVWGMSELSSSRRSCRADRLKLGTVGPAIPGVEVRLADDGEVLVRGRIVMAGYRNQPEKTAETIDADGWLHTGDIGAARRRRLPHDRRPQEGADHQRRRQEHVAGEHRAALKPGSPLIGQAVAIGDGRPYNVALIVLDPDASAAFAARARPRATPRAAAMAGERPCSRRSTAGVERANAHSRRVEQIKRFTVLAERLAAGRRRADADDEAQAPADRGEVRGRDRGALHARAERPFGPRAQAAGTSHRSCARRRRLLLSAAMALRLDLRLLLLPLRGE